MLEVEACLLWHHAVFTLRHEGDKQNWDHLVITDYSNWRAVETTGMPSSLLEKHLESQALRDIDVPYGIVGRMAGASEPLLKASCRRGFAGLTVPVLKKLWALDVKDAACPTLTADLIAGLAKEVLGPDVDTPLDHGQPGEE